jgi:hypothetical protein
MGGGGSLAGAVLGGGSLTGAVIGGGALVGVVLGGGSLAGSFALYSNIVFISLVWEVIGIGW